MYAVEFHRDTLFCSWAYFIDFEKRTLATYKANGLLDTVHFDSLKELGSRYMERLEQTWKDGKLDHDNAGMDF